jgi:hypothetical protein
MTDLKMVKITREQAEHWLGATVHQRRISTNTVNFLKADMQAGNWHPELAPPILIEKTTGEVINGRTRLLAFLETKKETLESYVDYVPRRAIEVVDTGRNRSLIDTLDIRGHENSRHKSAWLSRSAQWVTGFKPSKLWSRTQQVQVIEAAPHVDKAAEMAHFFQRLGGRKVYRMPAGTVAALWDMQQYGVGSEWVEEYCRRIQGSEDMDPLLTLTQSKLVEANNPNRAKTMSADTQSYVLARTFNAWVNDEELSRIYARRIAIRELPGYSEWVEATFAPWLDPKLLNR